MDRCDSCFQCFRTFACLVIVWCTRAAVFSSTMTLHPKVNFTSILPPTVTDDHVPIDGYLIITSLLYWSSICNFLLDCFLMHSFLTKFLHGKRYGRLVLHHQKPLPPLIVQSILFFPGVVYIACSTWLLLNDGSWPTMNPQEL